MINYDTLMRKFAWAILVISLSIDGVVAVEVMAQNRRLRRGRLALPQERKEKTNTDTTKNSAQNVLEIARSMSDKAENQMVDLVFIIDSSRSMANVISAIQRGLVDVASVFEERLVYCQFAQTSFEKRVGVPRMATQSFESDLVAIQARLRKLQASRNAKTGCGLDAILKTMREIEFRPDASKHLLVVTNSSLQTASTAEKAKDKMVREIVDLCEQDNVHINIIGVRESIQIQLTTRTDGKFRTISGDAPERIRFVSHGDLDKSILNIGRIFKQTAKHIVQTRKKSIDIIFMVDSSLRMAGTTAKIKVDRICEGIDEMANILNSAGVDYRFGVIRFWAATSSSESVVVFTKPPLTTAQVKQLFCTPKQGERNLLDAVVKSVPKLNTPNNRQLVLVIVTDRSTEHREEKGYTVDQAIGVCLTAGAQVNVIGESLMHICSYKGRLSVSTKPLSIVFQTRVTEITNGVHHVMPRVDGQH